MTTKISQIYDSMVSLVETLLPAQTQIPNPYFVDENNQLFLEKGFGIGIGSGSRVQTDTCHLAWNRLFTIVLVRQVTTTDNNIPDRASIEKEMLEDQYLIMNEIEGGSVLNVNDIKADILGDTGIQFLVGDKFKYLSIVIDVNILYQETYT